MSMNQTIPKATKAGNGKGLLMHAAGPLEQDALAGIPRSATNARAALHPEAGIEVVVQGPGVKLLAEGSPVAEPIKTVPGNWT